MSTGIESNGARFGCGFVFGLVFSAIGLFAYMSTFGYFESVAIIVTAVVFGFAALKFGDVFWRWVAKWLH
jgi:hypothetical protein